MASSTTAILNPKAGEAPKRGTLPIAADTIIVKGCMTQKDPAGRAVQPATADASGLPVVGISAATYDNRTAAESGGAAGAIDAEIEYGVFGFAYTGTAPVMGDRCYAVDNQTVSTSSANGTRGFVFVCSEVQGSKAYGQIGPRAAIDAGAAQNKARGVCYAANMSLTAFTVATNTDGITYVQGDVVVLSVQTAPEENGPYVVGPVAASAAVLTRPAWWAPGSLIPEGQTIQIGGEGTIFGGSEWKALDAKGKLVDTDDPVLYPRVCKGTVTLASGTKVLGVAQGLFLKSTTTSAVMVTRNTFHAGSTTTVGYDAPVASRTAGVAGTAALTINGCAAAGTHPGDDASDVDFQVTNW